MADSWEIKTDEPTGRTRSGARSGSTGSAAASMKAKSKRTGRSKRSASSDGVPPDTTVKKSVTLRQSVAEEIESRAGSRGFSSFLDLAAERYLALLNTQEIVADFEERKGAVSADALAEAERAWRGE